jgi:hypothetical protein
LVAFGTMMYGTHPRSKRGKRNGTKARSKTAPQINR